MTVFVLIALLMTAAAVLLLLPTTEAAAPVDDRARQNVRIAREQLAELEAAVADRRIDRAQYAEARDELEHALLDDLQGSESTGGATATNGQGRTTLLLAIALPLVATALYLQVGTPQAIDMPAQSFVAAVHPGAGDDSAAMYDMVQRLAKRLQANPDDIDGWMLLGRTRLAMQQVPQAEAAFARARELGAAKFDAKMPAVLGAKGLEVAITLDPALQGRVDPEDTLFVYARAVDGPPMPLAAVRRKVRDLPLRITLDDSMAMTPSLRLSAFERVKVGARISKTANAIAVPGDLDSKTVAALPGQVDTIRVVINQLID